MVCRFAVNRILTTIIVAGLAAGCDSARRGPSGLSSNAEEPSRRLKTVLERRLALMPAVARWKWEHGLPIEDPAREAEVVRAFLRRAEARGLEPAFAERLILAQIDAAKVVQRDCFQRWERRRPPVDSPVLNLATELRPRLDRLTDELLSVSATVRDVAMDPSIGTSPAMKRALSPWVEP